jgi:hypothetical protein
MTLASLMKLLVFKTDEKFVPFLLRLEKTFTTTLSAHDMFMWTSWIIIEYQARSISNTPVDRERCEVVNAIITATNRLVAAMEAIIAGDLQMALARAVHCYLPLIAFMAQIEARRFTANNGSSVIEDVLSNDAASAPSEIQSLAIQMERQKKLTDAIIPGNMFSMNAAGPPSQFFRSGGSGPSPAPLDPSAPFSGVIPYSSQLDLTSFAEALPPTQPQQQQPQQQQRQQQPQPTPTPTSVSKVVVDLNVHANQPRNPYNSNRPSYNNTNNGNSNRGRGGGNPSGRGRGGLNNYHNNYQEQDEQYDDQTSRRSFRKKRGRGRGDGS